MFTFNGTFDNVSRECLEDFNATYKASQSNSLEDIYRYASNGVYFDDSRYYSLDIVSKCKEPEYIPLSWETRNIIREKGGWVRWRGEKYDELLVYRIERVGVVVHNVDHVMFGWEYLFDKYEFLDGTPCGIKIP